MSIKSDLIGNSQDSFKTHLAQRGGRGLSTTFSTLNAQANAGMGKYPVGLHYDGCDKQSGGGYGSDKQSVADNATFKGSYPSFSKYTKSNQCAGYKSKKRKSKKEKEKENLKVNLNAGLDVNIVNVENLEIKKVEEKVENVIKIKDVENLKDVDKEVVQLSVILHHII